MAIKVHIYLFLVMAYMFATGKLKFFICYYMFILMHEISHVIVALALKEDVKEITLLPVGIYASLPKKITNKKELIISLAGPLASFLFANLLNNETFIMMNLFICIFNLIPIYPLDGGRILRCILMFFTSYSTTKKITFAISKFFVITLLLISIISAAYFKNYYMAILSIYIFYIAKDEIKKDKYYGIINYLQIQE